MIYWSEYAKLLIALVAIVDVPGNLPMFLKQTEGFTQTERRLTAITAGVTTAAILLLFALMGETILYVFGITIEAFKIVGGLVILLMALEMLGLIGNRTDSYDTMGQNHPISIGIFPMAVPLFAGPGAISAVVVYAHENFHSSHDLIVGSVIATVSLIIIVGLFAAAAVGRVLGPVTQSVISRLLGIIVATMGVEFMVEGMAAAFPNLVG
jgi:multiple antibiotic resistance protein